MALFSSLPGVSSGIPGVTLGTEGEVSFSSSMTGLVTSVMKASANFTDELKISAATKGNLEKVRL